MKYTLGIDIGTTGAKALLMSEAGEITASGSAEYPLLTPETNWAEQNPLDWWQGAVSAIKACLGQSARNSRGIVAIGLTGQMHSAVFLDGKGEVLRPAILWCDQRTDSQCKKIVDIVGFDRLIANTSNRALTGFTAPKILWLRENEPEAYALVQKVLLPKDYIRYRLTGAYATEVSDASGTLLFNVAKREWSAEVLEALEIPLAWMPDCCESPDITGHLSKGAADLLGLREGMPVVGGGGDQAAGAVGNGVVRGGLASCVLGTSGVLFWHSDTHVCDVRGRLHSFCHAIPGKWHLMAVTLSAGGSLRWFRDTLCHQEIAEAEKSGIDPYEIIVRQAASVAPGSEGLLFLPYLAGERTPYADASARGAFLGLNLRHTKAHMARAVLEGITMSLRDCLDLGREFGLAPKQMRLSGGGARSDMWRQMIADTFAMEGVRVGVEEGPAFGAAILAMVGAGVFASVEAACDVCVHLVDSVSPDPEAREVYQRNYDLYRPLYDMLRAHFDRSAAYVKRSE